MIFFYVPKGIKKKKTDPVADFDEKFRVTSPMLILLYFGPMFQIANL